MTVKFGFNGNRVKNFEIFERHRLSILRALLTCKVDSCGCDLLSRLRISKHLLSYHLRVLREHGWIKSCRKGRVSYYRLVPRKKDLVEKALRLLELIN